MKGIYIHIPFCLSKCPYCDFTSIENGDKKRYIEALIHEIELYDAAHLDSVNTIFFGGGTPTSIKAVYIENILTTLKNSFNVTETAEITIEANPGTVDDKKLTAYKKAGINRLSFGLQSAIDDELLKLGRVHTLSDFETSYELARKAGFDNINIDLMFGLPNQKTEDFSLTLDRVIEFNPEHISCYGLKLEKGTPFYKDYYGSADMPGDALEREMYHLANKKLCENGYIHYETSNFAKKGMACQHNLTYWHANEYLGFGVSAHGYFIINGEHIRQGNTSDIEKYIKDIMDDALPIDEKEQLTDKDIQEEYIMLNLRLNTGIDFKAFYQTFGFKFNEKFKDQIKTLLDGGLITQDKKGIYPTLKGFDLQNTMITMFL